MKKVLTVMGQVLLLIIATFVMMYIMTFVAVLLFTGFDFNAAINGFGGSIAFVTGLISVFVIIMFLITEYSEEFN